jgi:uncharacterized integral membrane protein (TIGR00698 family)
MQLTRERSKVGNLFFERLNLLHYKGYLQGILLTLALSFAATELSKLPFLAIMGSMVLSILLGLLWNGIMGYPSTATLGITFISKWLLRVGIILMGLRLDINQIFVAGAKVLGIDLFIVLFTFSLFILIGKWLKVPWDITILTGIGTAVCGAAAIMAIAPIIKAKQESTAAAVSIIAIIGTIVTIVYTLLYPLLSLSSEVYGILVGSTLHEIAHVIAAGQVGGEIGSESAILVKLGRVALLIPMALLISYCLSLKKNKQILETQSSPKPTIQFPFFILGFLAMSIINTLEWLSPEITDFLVLLSVFFLSMAMVAVGLCVNIKYLTNQSRKGFVLCALGSFLLALVGIVIINLLY